MSTAKRFKLTNARIRDLPARDATYIVWDDEIAGFGCRVMAKSGTKTLLLQRRTRAGRNCKLKLGRYPEVSTDWARQQAREYIRALQAGEDPAMEIHKARLAERERQRSPTVERLIAEWTAANEARWRTATLDAYRGWAKHGILPALGKKKAHEVVGSGIRQLYRSIVARGTASTANRTLNTLSAAYSWAISSDDWPLIKTNPVTYAIGRASRVADAKRTRYPQNGELERFVAVLCARADPAGKFFQLLLLTGCRRGELLHAKWFDFDLDAGVWTKPAHAVKQKRMHRLPLSPEAVQILRELRASVPFGGPFAKLRDHAIRQAWGQVLAAAQLADLRPHDIRHWHASLLASAGLSLPIIGALLGHSSQATTARYSHLIDQTLREATGRVAQVISLASRRAEP
jgi:integrase